jgi:hypothetical protein
MHAIAQTDRAQFLASLIEAEGVRYGREDSFKMSRSGLLTNRFLLGIPLQELFPDRLIQLCNALGMPQSCKASFLGYLRDANLVFFGLEDDGERGFYKVYLEFWDSVRRQVRRTGRTDPMLLNIGFKWRAGVEDSDVRVARYTCFPLLSVHDILVRLQHIYADGSEPVALDGASQIIRRAAAANPSASFLYVEVSEEGNPRKSFDVNIYKANLNVGDIQPMLSDLARHFCIPPETFQPWVKRIANYPLGHLSGGLDKDGRDFITTYYETHALDD